MRPRVVSSSKWENVYINPSHATYLFLYHLKTSESQRLSYVFREYRKKTVFAIARKTHDCEIDYTDSSILIGLS